MENKNYITLKVVGEIKTKQRPRATIIGGHARVYSPKNNLYYENYIKAMYQEKYPDFNFGNKPLAFTIRCYFKANQEMAKNTNETTIGSLPCKTHKDLDNIAKTVMDALNGIAFNDDKQITELRAFKYYTLDSERIEVTIEDITPYYLYQSLEHLKDIQKSTDLALKISVLNDKSKVKTLNKTESERYEKLCANYRELNRKIKEGRYDD